MAKEVWDALVVEMTKKPKMVITSIQCQLRNIKCSEEDDLQEHLDKAQDLYSRLNEMGATISEEEYMDIILASLPPSYEAAMNALTTSLEECDRPLEPDNIIRVLKAQYDKRRNITSTQEEQVLQALLLKRSLYALIVTSPDTQTRIVGLKVVEKKAKVLNKRNESNPKRRKGNIRPMQPKNLQMGTRVMNPLPS